MPKTFQECGENSERATQLRKVFPAKKNTVETNNKSKVYDESNIVHSRTVKKKNKTKNPVSRSESSNQEQIEQAKSSKPQPIPLSTSMCHWKTAQNVSLESVITKSVPDSKKYTSQWVHKSRKWNYFGTDHYKSRRVLPFVDEPRTSYGTFLPTGNIIIL